MLDKVVVFQHKCLVVSYDLTSSAGLLKDTMRDYQDEVQEVLESELGEPAAPSRTCWVLGSPKAQRLTRWLQKCMQTTKRRSIAMPP